MNKTLTAGDVVLVQFPYADRHNTKYRPALVVSPASFHTRYAICWVAMITSAANTHWSGDIALEPTLRTGLTADSVVRPAKLATIDLTQITKIGAVPAAIRKQALAFIGKQLT